jgi:hypothetical protein
LFFFVFWTSLLSYLFSEIFLLNWLYRMVIALNAPSNNYPFLFIS